jgi:predicted PurR-regulated permease PerM
VYSIFENFFLIPLLMKKAVDLNPALIILVVLLGSKIAGILGIILAIPAAAIVSVLIDEYIQLKSKRASLEVLEQ